MHRFALILTATLLATPAIAEWNQIDSKAEFQELVINKNFVHQETKAWFRFNSNGQLTGGARGEKLTGKWRWSGGQACYTRKLGKQSFPRDCVTLWVDGKKGVTKRKSDGRQVAYVIQ
ncbi:MAG: hypothetical protein AAF718_09840 [Pseudomonadota bacterium]